MKGQDILRRMPFVQYSRSGLDCKAAECNWWKYTPVTSLFVNMTNSSWFNILNIYSATYKRFWYLHFLFIYSLRSLLRCRFFFLGCHATRCVTPQETAAKKTAAYFTRFTDNDVCSGLHVIDELLNCENRQQFFKLYSKGSRTVVFHTQFIAKLL